MANKQPGFTECSIVNAESVETFSFLSLEYRTNFVSSTRISLLRNYGTAAVQKCDFGLLLVYSALKVGC